MDIQETLTLSDYEPSENELKLLKTLLNPKNRNLSITEKTEQAGISRQMYYYYMKKQGFVDLLRKASKNLVVSEIPDIIHAFVNEAKKGSFKHGKLLLEMSEMYSDKIEISSTSVHAIVGGRDISKMTDMEMIQLAKEQGIELSDREKEIFDAKYRVIEDE
jgi:hypothetical protein